DGTIATAGSALLIFAYPGLAMGCFLAIRHEHSAWILLWIFATTKSSDIGAYFTGKAIGRRKLIPWLSPGKTWEGLFGGIAFASAVGALGAWLLQANLDPQAPSPWIGLLLGAIIAVLGQLGDLAASMFKRDAGVKDSGSRIPGFGGLLDLADSTLIVGVAAYWTLLLGN
ncbi:MAG: phosphatidate cytidylyltransferase, partial [Planctomycetota bacterium]